MVVVDVVVMDVLGGRSARHHNLGGGRIGPQGGSSGPAPIRRGGARRASRHARRLAARRLQDAGQVLVQDGLRIFFARVGGGEQRVLEGGAAEQVGALLSFLLLERRAEQRRDELELLTEHPPVSRLKAEVQALGASGGVDGWRNGWSCSLPDSRLR